MENQKKQRIIGILILTGLVGVMVLIAGLMARPLLALSRNPEELRTALSQSSHQPLIVLGFLLLVILQVFAAIVPGGPFEIAAGYAFGVLPGALLCDAAMTFASICVFQLSRKFGMRFVKLFVTEEKLREVKILHTTDNSRLIIFLLFLIPGTPKDILSYLVGLTDLSLRDWIFITAVGRFPSILLSALSGSALQSERYEIFLVVLVVIGALSVLGSLWYRKHNHD